MSTSSLPSISIPSPPTSPKRRSTWLSNQVLSPRSASSASKGPRKPNSRKTLALGILIPVFTVTSVWFVYLYATARRQNVEYASLFTDSSEGSDVPYYWMSVTMVFGSLIAGATSEGGASVAFPVMTLAFGIEPIVARDFSLLVQSVGMTSASFNIYWMSILVERNTLLYVSLGGVGGMIFGLEFVADQLPPSFTKMYFVTVWLAFATNLYWLNLFEDRRTFDVIPDFESNKQKNRSILLVTGFVGGILSSIAGSGIDITNFAVLTLLFRVSERTATPTSVCLMAINTVVGATWKGAVHNSELSQDCLRFFLVCVPIVVFGAPMGSLLGSYFDRKMLAKFVYVTDTVQFVCALVTSLALRGVGEWVVEVPTSLNTPQGVLGGGAKTTPGERMWEDETMRRELKLRGGDGDDNRL
ncbi:hypothetical protein TrST_g12049 [Triparma strigata]|uniref:Sulfite exporter TauE/SafE family protein n=1 Tax=Triparma strigata TaxID=1606541 RepID=A0A9W7E2V1_9STRA|nr:hypothetical protein TrST_g12049 [Triparma strigata]